MINHGEMVDQNGERPRGTERVRYAWNDPEPLTAAVLEAVASAEQIDPTELESLTSRIDPDALDALFSPRLDGRARVEGVVQFPLGDYVVSVYADGEIIVQSPGAGDHKVSL